MNDEIRRLFPAAEKHTYLNSAAVSPMPRTALDAVRSQLEDVSENGSANYLDWVATKNRARALIGGMLNVEPETIAFMRNTSDGFAAVASGMSWKAGDNIVSFANEFPANYYAWRHVRDKFGVELRMAPEHDGRIDLDELIALIDSNTKLVAISAVQFASGFTVDLERIAKAAHAVDAFLAVDIIQGLGARGFDLPAAEIFCAVDDLALQVRFFHDVEIDDADTSDARRREIHADRRAQSAGANHQDARSFQLPLP